MSGDQQRCLRGTIEDPSLRIHGVIHSGAKVHYSSDYESLEPANVQSTKVLLEITALSKYISAFVFVSGGRNPDDICTPEDLSRLRKIELNRASGYTQTKLISQLLVERCRGHVDFRDKELYITKPGYIIGNPESGIANQSDFIWRLIAGCIEVGAYNQEECDHWLFMADVNHVAESVVAPLFQDRNKSIRTHTRRVLDGLRFSELWELLRGEFGYALEALPFKEWMGCLKSAILEKQEKHLLFPLLHVMETDGAAIGSPAKPVGLTKDSTERVKNAVRSNVRYLIQAGFMPKPKS